MTAVTLLDASAVLAFLQGEPGQDVVRLALQSGSCVVTAANQAEIIAKILDRGADPGTVKAVLGALGYAVIDVGAQDGEIAGWMRSQTRAIGLSLGDRLCLAVAQRLNAVVLTADRLWLTVAQPMHLNIQCIRWVRINPLFHTFRPAICHRQ